MRLKSLLLLLLIGCSFVLEATVKNEPKFSTAGFYVLPETGRAVYSMNPGWRLYKGELQEAFKVDFDDSSWEPVSLPNGIELLPTEASGCINYQGDIWYRKHFDFDPEWSGKRLFVHFEAIMGESKIWLNGHQLGEHYGGYLPVVVDITDYINHSGNNVLAVWCNNEDNPNYPPGKPQESLDFTYFGGIYRDCWLIAHNNVYITDPNFESNVAGGGLFISYFDVSDSSAGVHLDLHVRNSQKNEFNGEVSFSFYDKNGSLAAVAKEPLHVKAEQDLNVSTSLKIEDPTLWSPDAPNLYHLHVIIADDGGEVVDGYMRRIGIRSIEFKGRDGFWLNGKPYPEPLIGANRHQDYAVVGNALSNSLHWRDAKKLRDAGLRVIRNAHYPQDPAFMDACDELGLFVIVNTPGWQFWNEDPIFEERVYSDIRNMVRRDRNHPSVWMWEPILNETWYPEHFALKVKNIVAEEYPYPYAYSACDASARGNQYYAIRFTHPQNGLGGAFNADVLEDSVCYFTREWGDNVDDWFSHNSPSRVSREWGEMPMLIQAQGYAKPDYVYTCYDVLYKTPRQHMGGCLWHPFDHQRGYHPDPFYGGIMDSFRQKKYSYFMFEAQRSPKANPDAKYETGPMVYIANAMTPFSPKDVTVYSNCDVVKLTSGTLKRSKEYSKNILADGMPSPIIVFEDMFDVMADKKLARDNMHDESYLLAEGFINGQLVATHKVMPARRPTKIVLRADTEGIGVYADGSDLITVVASIVDDRGNIKRLNNSMVRFEVDGPAVLVSSPETFTNPRKVEWGTAPVLLRTTTNPGKIRVRASMVYKGIHTPIAGELTLISQKTQYPMVFNESEVVREWENNKLNKRACTIDVKETVSVSETRFDLEEVSKQQTEFE